MRFEPPEAWYRDPDRLAASVGGKEILGTWAVKVFIELRFRIYYIPP